MLRYVMAALALQIAAAPVARGEATAESGSTLVRQCEELRPAPGRQGDPVEAARCLAYIIGVFDGLRVVSASLRDPILCPPASVGDAEFATIFLEWARYNPTLLPRYPAHSVAEALVRRFPCPH